MTLPQAKQPIDALLPKEYDDQREKSYRTIWTIGAKWRAMAEGVLDLRHE
jgi:hypothetical protein